MKIFTKIFDVVLFVLGVGILIFSLLNYGGGGWDLDFLYYKMGAKFGFVLGAPMIVFGFLIKYWLKEDK